MGCHSSRKDPGQARRPMTIRDLGPQVLLDAAKLIGPRTPQVPQDAPGAREGADGHSPATKGRAGRIRSNPTPSCGDHGHQGEPAAFRVLLAEVMGPPVPYGNKRAFRNPKTGGMIVVERNSHNLRTWQDALRKAMLLNGLVPVATFDQPKKITVTFYLARPKSHFGKRGLTAKGLASRYPTRRPDCDKVGRAVADCGTGIWYADDAQLVEWRIAKRWAPDGLERTVVEVEDVEP
jgi:Holliday junction resolvase RusA-like endonuclease